MGKECWMGTDLLAEDRGLQYNNPHIYLDSKK